MPKRLKTKYAGVYYREANRIGGKGTEKVYYVTFKKDGKTIEEKAGRQFVDDMTPARASGIRAELIEGKRLLRKEQKQLDEERKKQEEGKQTIDRLWKEYKKQRTLGKSLKIDTGRYEKYLKDPFGDKEPHEILPLETDRLRLRLLKKLSPQTVKHILNLLTWIINFGANKGLSQGLTFTIKKPTVDNKKTEDLSAEQLKRLLATIEKSLNVMAGNMMKFALYTGMRRGEMFKLEWRDVDFERGFINIRDPKGIVDQKIPLNDAARDLLEIHPRSRSKFVFPGRKGRQRTDIKHQVNKIKEDAGLPKNFRALHGLRHVYASMLASSGQVDMYTLQKLLTHKNPFMTQRYAHLRDEALKKASALAGDIIEQAAKDRDEEQNKVVNLKDHKK